MVVKAENRLKIEIDETSLKTKVEFHGERIGLVNKVEIEVAADEKLAKAKLYFYLPKANIQVVDDQIEIFKVVGMSVKEFADVVRERDILERANKALRGKIKFMEEMDRKPITSLIGDDVSGD